MNDKEILAYALKERHPSESLEKAVGRAVRSHSGRYEDYVRIMGDVRELADKKRMTIVEAANEIAGQP